MDYPYILLIITLSILLYLEKYKRKDQYFKFTSLLVLLFIGLRAPTVGADTLDYFNYFIGRQKYYNLDNRELEKGLEIYNAIIGVFTARIGRLYLLVNAFFCLLPVYFLIKKYSTFKTLSVLLFYLICNYEIYFVALRQTLGMSFLFWGVYFLGGNSKWRGLIIYLFCSLLGYAFHTSIIAFSLIYMLLYFVPIRKKFFVYMLITSSMLLGAIFRKIDIAKLFELVIMANISATERLEGYLTYDLADVDYNIVALLLPSFVAFWIYNYMDKEKVNHWFSKIYMSGVIFFNIFNQVPMITRLNVPFTLMGIIVFTWVYQSKAMFFMGGMRQRIMLSILILLTVVFLKRNIYYEKDSVDKMHPYTIFNTTL